MHAIPDSYAVNIVVFVVLCRQMLPAWHTAIIISTASICSAAVSMRNGRLERNTLSRREHDTGPRLAYGTIQDIYVINLDRRTDRLASVKKQLDALSLPFIRFPAIDGRVVAELTDGKKGLTNKDLGWHPAVRFKTDDMHLRIDEENEGQWGRFGCWQSHLQVYLTAIDRAKSTKNDGPFLVLEDDVLIDADMPYLVKQAVDTLPSNWEFFAIGHLFSSCSKVVSRFACQASRIIGGQGYIVRDSKAAAKLVDMSNTENFQIADLLWLDAMDRGDLHAFMILPSSIIQQDRDSFGSDIPSSPGIPPPNLRLIAGYDHGEVVPLPNDKSVLGHAPILGDGVGPQSNCIRPTALLWPLLPLLLLL